MAGPSASPLMPLAIPTSPHFTICRLHHLYIEHISADIRARGVDQMFNLGKVLLDLAPLQLNIALTLHLRRVRFIFAAIAGGDDEITQKGNRGLLSGDEQEQTLTQIGRLVDELACLFGVSIILCKTS